MNNERQLKSIKAHDDLDNIFQDQEEMIHISA